MNESITQPSEQPDQPTWIAMQSGLALLDLLAALKPETKSARHRLRTRLQAALQLSDPENWFHRRLLEQMLDELSETDGKDQP